MKFVALIRTCIAMGTVVGFLAPNFSHAFGESATIQNYVNRATLVPMIKPSWGNFILHTDQLNKLYSLRGYQAIWVNENGQPNEMAQALKATLATADRHGLNSADYWDADVENAANNTLRNPSNWITFELMASEAMIRYATHLSTGRFDPEQVDTDIKYKKKDFVEYNELQAAVSAGPTGLSAGLDRVAPSHQRYQDLMAGLAQLKAARDAGGWPTLKSPGYILKKGVKDPIIQRLRTRLNQLGYSVSDSGGTTFDAEFETALKLYQSKNGMTVDGVIGTRSEVLRNLNYTVNQRMNQVMVTMEKLRWLPKTLEQRHIFVNLATTEFRLQDETGEVFYFKTVNGQPFRRTPSMRDQITFVNLNPTWTVPFSIAIKDKIPRLQEDPNFLEKHNMYLFDSETDRRVDPATIDWDNISNKNFSYYIVQNPGPDNALGVVKFPLQNPWSIYMHDTNEKDFFKESQRHLSSGCVRLEKPLELAAYLLKDQPQWSLDAIKAFVPLKNGDKAGELEKNVTLKKAIPVYFMYLTAEKSETGALRFVDDVYGQDLRLAKALFDKKETEMAAEKLTGGFLQVNGTPGKFQIFQKVKAVRCDLNRRGACDAPINFALNQAQSLPEGDYIVGFENSLYPQPVHVDEGQTTVLNLEKLSIPPSVRGQKIRIYRDFAQPIEQEKILLEMFTIGHHFTRLDKNNFGDLYLAGSWERDFVQRFTYEMCPKLNEYDQASDDAHAVCDAWNGASSPEDLRPIFQFGSDGTFQEMWVTYPGDVIPLKHPRYLVSAPMTESDFVAVFPGAYKVQAEGKGSSAVTLKVGNVQ